MVQVAQTPIAEDAHGMGVFGSLLGNAHEQGVSIHHDADVMIRHLGRTDYATTFAAMRTFTEQRRTHTPDEIWLTEHNPVFTLGLASRREHVLRDIGIPLVQADRGGQVTYHGPGQVVAYVLIDLRRRGLKVRETVQTIEQAVIRVLHDVGVHGFTRAGMPGVYVGAGDKIAALGLKVMHGCAYHGVSLNVNLDLSPYAAIDACGYPGLRSTSLHALGIVETPDAVAARLGHTLASMLPRPLNAAAPA
jgi:lipoyl(octanoyl) transferase